VSTAEKKLADVSNNRKLDAPTGKKKKKSKLSNEDQQTRITQIAAKFTYMNMLWLPGLGETFRISLDPDYLPANRFKSPEDQQQGVFADLLEVIPSKWHGEMETNALSDTVSSYTNFVR